MKAAIFARVSSVSDRQSTDRQVSDLINYATQNSIDVERVFEEHISGVTANAKREVLNECLDYAVNNGIELILCSEMSRLSRSVYDLQESIKFCVDHNINVFFQKEGISLFDSDGKQSMLFPILVSVLGVVSQMERENIKFRLNSGRKLYKERGGKLGRKVGSVKTEEQMKEQYKEVIKCLKKGYSVANTLAICKSKGVKCSTSTIKRIKKGFLN